MTEIVLHGFRYEILRPLGIPGAVAQAYLAKALDLHVPLSVVIKVPSLASPLGPQAVEQLEDEARVLAVLNKAEGCSGPACIDARSRAQWAADTVHQRLIVANIDHGETLDGQYLIVQEMAPPEVELVPVSDRISELRALALARRLAQAVSIAHDCDIALRDFKPQAKIDRLRVAWDGNQPVNFKLIDWNISGGRDLIPNDLLFLGNMIFALLTGRFPPLERIDENRYSLPPFDPQALAGPAWEHLSEGSRLLLKRLVNRQPTRRFHSARSIAEEIGWLEDLLSQQEISPARWTAMLSRYRDNAYRILALVATARTAQLPSYLRLELERAEQSAQRQIQAADDRFIRGVRRDLEARVFSAVLSRLDDMLDNNRLDPDGEAARKAHYLRQQARLGQNLRDQGVDVRRSEEYKRIKSAVDSLIDRRWEEAHRELDRLPPSFFEQQPTARALRAVAEWRLEEEKIQQAIQAERAQPEDSSLSRDLYEQKEAARLAILQGIHKRLEAWKREAPFEADLAAQAYALSKQIEVRQRFLSDLKSIRSKIEVGDESGAIEYCRQLVREHPDHYLAQFLIREAESSRRLRAELQDLRNQLQEGHYDEVIQIAQRLQNGCPEGIPPAVWERVCQYTGLMGIVERAREAQAKVNQIWLGVSEKQESLKSLSRRIDDLPPEMGVQITKEELEIGQEIQQIQSQVREWRRDHEQQNSVLPVDLAERLDEMMRGTVYLLSRLVGRRVADLDAALDDFKRDTAVGVEALIAQLRAWGPSSEQAERIRQAEERLSRLKDLLVQTDRSLSSGDLDVAVESFVRVSQSADVVSSARERIRSLLKVWEGIRDKRWPPLPSGAEGEEPWPGYGLLRERIRQHAFGALSRTAHDSYQAGQWEKVRQRYEWAQQYGKLDENQRVELKEACRYSETLRDVSSRTTVLAPNDQVFEEEWQRLKDIPGQAAEDLREKLLTRWQDYWGRQLPLDPDARTLDLLATRFEEAYTKTLALTMHERAEAYRRAEEVARHRKDWDDLEQWIARRDDSIWLEELHQIPYLGAVADRWLTEWRQKFVSHWQAVVGQARRDFKEGRAADALKSIQQANELIKSLCPQPSEDLARDWREGCLQKHGIALEDLAFRDFVALETRVQALDERDRVFTEVLGDLANPDAAPTQAQIDKLKKACQAAQVHDLPAQEAAERLVEWIEAVRTRQQALEPRGSEQEYAVWLEALRVKPVAPFPQESVSDIWKKRLTDWWGRIEHLSGRAAQTLTEVQAGLGQQTNEAVQRLVERIRDDKADEALAVQTAVLLWQVAWQTAPEVNLDPEGRALSQVEEWVRQIADAVKEARNRSIRDCGGPVEHAKAREHLDRLAGVVKSLQQRPPGVEFPVVEADWRPGALDKLQALPWRGLRNDWATIGQPLQIGRPTESVVLLGERVALLSKILDSMALTEGALADTRRALEEARQIAEARSRVEQALEKDNLLAAQEAAMELPPALDAEAAWQIKDVPDWLLEPTDSAAWAIQQKLKPQVKECLSLPEEQALACLREKVTPLVDRGIRREIIGRAIAEAALDVAGGYEDQGDRGRAAAVWRVVRQAAPSRTLRRKAGQEIWRLKGGKRRLVIVGVVALIVVVATGLGAWCAIRKKDIDIRATQTAVAQTATQAARVAGGQVAAVAGTATAEQQTAVAQAVTATAQADRANATGTATAAVATRVAEQTAQAAATTAAQAATATAQAEGFRQCKIIDFEILEEPQNLPTVSQKSVRRTLTWKVRNKAQDPNCGWGGPGEETDLLRAVEIVDGKQGSPIRVTVKCVEENVYELSLADVRLPLGEHTLTWRLLIPERAFHLEYVPAGPELQVHVHIVTPTPTPTPTLTPTPTPTPTWTPSPTPTPTPHCYRVEYECNCRRDCTTDGRTGKTTCKRVCDTCTREECD